MDRLPQLPAQNTANVQGIDLIRLIDVRDVAGLMPPELVWSGAAPGCLPVGGLVPNPGAVWIDIRFVAGTSQHTETFLKSAQGESWRQLLTMPIPVDSPDCGKLTRMLSRGRWLALRMDGNEVVRLIGTVAQPLKITDLMFTTSGQNAWAISLVSTGPHQAYYMPGWAEDEIYGNPADFSFEFSLQFNA